MVLTLDLPAVPAASNIRGLDCGINLVHPHRLCPTNFHVLYCPKLVRDSCVGYMRVRRSMCMCICWLNYSRNEMAKHTGVTVLFPVFNHALLLADVMPDDDSFIVRS